MSHASEKFIFEADGASLVKTVVEMKLLLKTAQKSAKDFGVAAQKGGREATEGFDRSTSQVAELTRSIGIATGRTQTLKAEHVAYGRAAKNAFSEANKQLKSLMIDTTQKGSQGRQNKEAERSQRAVAEWANRQEKQLAANVAYTQSVRKAASDEHMSQMQRGNSQIVLLTKTRGESEKRHWDERRALADRDARLTGQRIAATRLLHSQAHKQQMEQIRAAGWLTRLKGAFGLLPAGMNAAGKASAGFTKKMKLQSMAVSQAAFGVQDFVQVLTQPGMGFIPAMRASANNMQQTLYLMSGMKGALIGIAAGIAISALPALASMFRTVKKDSGEALDSMKTFNDYLEERKVALSKLAPGITKVGLAKIEAKEAEKPMLEMVSKKRREYLDQIQKREERSGRIAEDKGTWTDGPEGRKYTPAWTLPIIGVNPGDLLSEFVFKKQITKFFSERKAGSTKYPKTKKALGGLSPESLVGGVLASTLKLDQLRTLTDYTFGTSKIGVSREKRAEREAFHDAKMGFDASELVLSKHREAIERGTKETAKQATWDRYTTKQKALVDPSRMTDAERAELKRDRPPRSDRLIIKGQRALVTSQENRLLEKQGGQLMEPQRLRFEEMRRKIADRATDVTLHDLAGEIRNAIEKMAEAGIASPKLAPLLEDILKALKNQPPTNPPPPSANR